MQEKDNINWYAMKVFYNRTDVVKSRLEGRVVETYSQKVMPSLLFVRCSAVEILKIRRDEWASTMVYSNPETKMPSAIPEGQMAMFMLVTSSGDKGLEYLGEDKPEYHLGDRVRVISGILKGAEGHIKRIKKDRRLIVTIEGVAAIATSYIKPELLEKVTETP